MKKIKFYPFSRDTSLFADPPKPATAHVPEWYKKQPGQIDDMSAIKMGFVSSTVKRCMPVFDAMTAGYILALPCDIYLDATDPDRLVYSIPGAMAELKSALFSSHDIKQYSEYPIDKTKFHKDLLRLHPFWIIGTESGYSTLVMQPLNADDTPLNAISGIIDTDKFLTDGHFSFVVDKTFKGILKKGTPLAQVIPFKRESFVSEIVDDDTAEKTLAKQRRTVRSVFIGGYKNSFRSKKEYK